MARRGVWRAARQCGLASHPGSIGTPILFLADKRAATAYVGPIGPPSPHCPASGPQTFVLATCNGLARVFLGAHNPLDVAGGAAIGLAIAAVLDMVLDVARDRGRRPPGKNSRAREDRAT
jgi:PAP2 superfamily